jgi:hypothetical protein
LCYCSGFARILPVEVRSCFFCASFDQGGRFPSVIFRGIPLPLDEVLDAFPFSSRVEDLFDFEFFEAIGHLGRRRGWSSLMCCFWGYVWREETFVEHLCEYRPSWGYLEFVCRSSDLSEDFEGSYPFVLEFLHGVRCFRELEIRRL